MESRDQPFERVGVWQGVCVSGCVSGRVCACVPASLAACVCMPTCMLDPEIVYVQRRAKASASFIGEFSHLHLVSPSLTVRDCVAVCDNTDFPQG